MSTSGSADKKATKEQCPEDGQASAPATKMQPELKRPKGREDGSAEDQLKARKSSELATNQEANVEQHVHMPTATDNHSESDQETAEDFIASARRIQVKTLDLIEKNKALAEDNERRKAGRTWHNIGCIIEQTEQLGEMIKDWLRNIGDGQRVTGTVHQYTSKDSAVQTSDEETKTTSGRGNAQKMPHAGGN